MSWPHHISDFSSFGSASPKWHSNAEPTNLNFGPEIVSWHVSARTHACRRSQHAHTMRTHITGTHSNRLAGFWYVWPLLCLAGTSLRRLSRLLGWGRSVSSDPTRSCPLSILQASHPSCRSAASANVSHECLICRFSDRCCCNHRGDSATHRYSGLWNHPFMPRVASSSVCFRRAILRWFRCLSRIACHTGVSYVPRPATTDRTRHTTLTQAGLCACMGIVCRHSSQQS